MTTVAFVTYSFQSLSRRVGPMPFEPAEVYARELSRKAHITNVRLETWMCVDSKDFKSDIDS